MSNKTLDAQLCFLHKYWGNFCSWFGYLKGEKNLWPYLNRPILSTRGRNK